MSRQTPKRTLHDSETLQTLVVNLQQGIYITSERHRILDANPALLEMFGVESLDGLRSYPTADLLVDPAEREQELAILRRDGAVREFELRLRRPDGQVRVVLDTAYALTDPETGERLFLGILQDITERKRMEEQLRELSFRDPLTGSYNRRRLGELEQQLRLQDACWGAIIIDIDNFKRYNDVHGHQAGDEVLVRVSRFLNQCIRNEDTVIRVGGDEFVVVVAGTSGAATEIVAQRLEQRALVACPVPFSLGWAVREGDESLERTIDRADQRLIQVRVRERGRERRAVSQVSLRATSGSEAGPANTAPSRRSAK